MPMTVVDHASQPKDQWRPGVMTRMIASAATGTGQLAVFEQWCDPGLGAPAHLHAVEEILTVLEGEALRRAEAALARIRHEPEPLDPVDARARLDAALAMIA